jgi:hypothetical protein
VANRAALDSSRRREHGTTQYEDTPYDDRTAMIDLGRRSHEDALGPVGQRVEQPRTRRYVGTAPLGTAGGETMPGAGLAERPAGFGEPWARAVDPRGADARLLDPGMRIRTVGPAQRPQLRRPARGRRVAGRGGRTAPAAPGARRTAAHPADPASPRVRKDAGAMGEHSQSRLRLAAGKSARRRRAHDRLDVDFLPGVRSGREVARPPGFTGRVWGRLAPAERSTGIGPSPVHRRECRQGCWAWKTAGSGT